MIMRQRKFFSSRLFTIGVVLFTAIVVLGFFRLQVSRFEQLLSGIDQRIERYSAEEVQLKQTFSGLASPIKIYAYCKDMLGMDKVKRVEMVHVPAVRSVAVPSPKSQKGWRSNVFSLLGFSVN
jgi:cell division protein FtsB